MDKDGDDLVSLPVPPPPRPTARREAIDAALRKFDGIEDAPSPRHPQPEPRSRPRWATMHRRPAGALVAAGLIAAIAIPVIRTTVLDGPDSEIGDASENTMVRADPAAKLPTVADEPPEPATDEAAAAEEVAAPAQARASPHAAAEEVSTFAPVAREEKMQLTPPQPARISPATPPVAAAAPPPPPLPPPAELEAEAQADAGQNIVVTGSKVRRSNLDSAAPVTVTDPLDDFLFRLHAGAATNDRQALIGLIAFPLRVDFEGESRTYRSRREVERDFDRIFTPAVKRTALALRPDRLMIRDGGRLKGQGGLWFGCGRQSCAGPDKIRIREIRP